jgi:hypothetical protein
MNTKFIYDEKTSSLYAPDGTLLKKVYCPKAIRWNQLIVNDKEDRWRKCSRCKESILNLDVLETDFVLKVLQDEFSSACIHASSNSKNVIFLKDMDAIPEPSCPASDEEELIIYTARTIEDINRAVGMGYWPDVRLVNYNAVKIQTKISIGQNTESGQIDTSGDYRRRFGRLSFNSFEKTNDDNSNKWEEVIPFTGYYPHFQSVPVAAYLIPNGVENNANVVVLDPIEDIVGGRWNQGATFRAHNVPGFIKDKKVYLEPEKIKVSEFMG